ncbi:HDOD domain-containing protein [bacterium]|nr:HDOD domain-containing protein [bacterium]
MNTSQGRVLVVESDAIRGDTLRELLETTGAYDVSLATSPQEALGMVVREQFQLILTNTTVEVVSDGIHMSRAIIKLKENAPAIIALANQADSATINLCVRSGVEEVLVYPYDPPILLERIARVLHNTANSDPGLDLEVKKTLNEIVDLPTISAVHAKLENLVQDETTNVGATDLGLALSLDQATTSKVLRLANSALFGASGKITSLSEAIDLLGFKVIRNAILTMSRLDTREDIPELDDFPRIDFWKHSVAVGMISKELAVRLDIDPEMAQLGGILHDIGKIVLATHFTKAFQSALKTAKTKSYPILRAEKEEIRFTHASVGGYLAARWGLPASITGIIGGHHSLDVPHADLPLTSLVHVSNCIARGLQMGRAGDDTEPSISPDALDALDLTKEKLGDWTPDLAVAAEEVIHKLGISADES